MIFTTLVSTELLFQNLDNPDWVVVDCRFRLADPEQVKQEYKQSHIPGAVYADLDKDLSGPIIPGKTGRHPLPGVEKLAQTFSSWGVGPGTQVVAYDDAGGALAAARLWWMLRWLGHEASAVLDGGWKKWLKEGKPVRGESKSRPARVFVPHLRPELVVTVEQVDSFRKNPVYRLVDARANDRFHGQNETIDPVPGHIPGAFNLPYAGNISPEGVFIQADELFERFRKLSEGVPAENVVFYCGSGVTAAHNILAMLYSGLGEARLFPGSWSEWIADPSRPIET